MTARQFAAMARAILDSENDWPVRSSVQPEIRSQLRALANVATPKRAKVKAARKQRKGKR